MAENLESISSPVEEVSPAGEAEEGATETVFFWLDILGFSALVEDKSEIANLGKHLQKFQRLFNDLHLVSSHIVSDGLLLAKGKYFSNKTWKSFFPFFEKKHNDHFSFPLTL